MKPKGGHGNDGSTHTHTINLDYTHLNIESSGNHTHSIHGETESQGKNNSFSLMNPYQTLNYIIYAGPTST